MLIGHASTWQVHALHTTPANSMYCLLLLLLPPPGCVSPVLAAGLYAVGLLAVAWLARISVSGLLSSSRAARAWQLDLIVFRGIVCSLAGVHVVHCLGAAWLTWLLMWLVWVGCQLVLQLVQLSSSSSTLMALGVALGLPLLMAVAPFHVSGLLLQGWLLDALPWLQRALVLQGLLGLPIGS